MHRPTHDALQLTAQVWMTHAAAGSSARAPKGLPAEHVATKLGACVTGTTHFPLRLGGGGDGRLRLLLQHRNARVQLLLLHLHLHCRDRGTATGRRITKT